MRRNEDFIADLSCPYVQQALLQCRDDALVQRLMIAFPGAFYGIARIGTWKDIRLRWGRWCQGNGWNGNNQDVFYVTWLAAILDEDDFPQDDYLEFGIYPPVDDGESSDNEIGKNGEVIPSEIQSQLEAVESFTEPIVIKYKDEDWLVGWLGFSDGSVLDNAHDLLFDEENDSHEISLQLVRVGSIV